MHRHGQRISPLCARDYSSTVVGQLLVNAVTVEVESSVRAVRGLVWFDLPGNQVSLYRLLFSQSINLIDLAVGFFVIHDESHLDRFRSCINQNWLRTPIVSVTHPMAPVEVVG